MSNGTVALPRALGKRLGSLPLTIGSAALFLVAYGLHHGWGATFGRFFQWLGHKGISLSLRAAPDVSIHPFGFLLTIDRDMRKWLNDAQRYTEKGMVWGFTNFIELPLLVAGTMLAAGLAIFELGEWTTSYVQKALRSHHEARANPQLRALQTDILRDEARLRDLERWKRAGGAAAGSQDWAVLRRGIDRLKDRVKDLEVAEHGAAPTHAHAGGRAVPRQAVRGKHWRDVLSKDAAVALTAVALGGLGLGFLRCPSFLRIGKRMGCGGFGLLEGLLASTLEAMVVLDLCRFAVTAQALARKVVPALGVFLLVQDAVCLGGGATLPSAHDSPKITTRITLPSAHD